MFTTSEESARTTGQYGRCYLQQQYHSRHSKDPLKRQTTPFNSVDLERSIKTLVKHVQDQVLTKKKSQLSKNVLGNKSLRRLNPLLDDEDILRVGGRLAPLNLSLHRKHPGQHRLTQLIIEYIHKKYLHPGLQTLHSLLIQNFWIVSSKRDIGKEFMNVTALEAAPNTSSTPYGKCTLFENYPIETLFLCWCRILRSVSPETWQVERH
ncbi:hypothetical protein JTB14_036447 [Gonioctena quinquepunctata]|nr:hypothetical protein JTB14_036447 [Gonioctena quinquepunctata]